MLRGLREVTHSKTASGRKSITIPAMPQGILWTAPFFSTPAELGVSYLMAPRACMQNTQAQHLGKLQGLLPMGDNLRPLVEPIEVQLTF